MNTFTCPHCGHLQKFNGKAGDDIVEECDSCEEICFLSAIEVIS